MEKFFRESIVIEIVDELKNKVIASHQFLIRELRYDLKEVINTKGIQAEFKIMVEEFNLVKDAQEYYLVNVSKLYKHKYFDKFQKREEILFKDVSKIR